MPAYSPEDVFGTNYAISIGGATKTITFAYVNAAPNGAFDMPEITDDLANEITGDVRTVIYGLLEKLAEWYEALPTANRPEFMRVSRSGSVSDVGGVTYINRNYIVTFKAQAGTLALIPET